MIPRTIFPNLGTRFGRLVLVGLFRQYFGKSGQSFNMCRCQCDCGRDATVRLNSLESGKTISCGCYASEIFALHLKPYIKHGGAVGNMRTPEYRIWTCMKRRCFNVNTPEFPHYGGRGITVCDAWRDSFTAFLSDMGCRPSPKHSIDRIDNNGNYDPNNVRWATMPEQRRNARSNRLLTHNGSTMCVTDWAVSLDWNIGLIYKRLDRGWSVSRALSESPHSEFSSKKAKHVEITREGRG